jgi:hypothetical protein
MVQDNDDSGNGAADDFKSVLVSSRGGLDGVESAGGAYLENKLRPTLGTGWYHTVTTRMLMMATHVSAPRQEDEDGDRDRDRERGTIGQRYFSISKSPMVRLQSIPYSIGPTGITGASGSSAPPSQEFLN